MLMECWLLYQMTKFRHIDNQSHDLKNTVDGYTENHYIYSFYRIPKVFISKSHHLSWEQSHCPIVALRWSQCYLAETRVKRINF